jgi:hypothetical protein
VVLRRRGAGLTRDSSIHTLGSEEGISGAKEGLFRCHSEEIFNRKNLAICGEIMAEDFVEHAHAPLRGPLPEG